MYRAAGVPFLTSSLGVASILVSFICFNRACIVKPQLRIIQNEGYGRGIRCTLEQMHCTQFNIRCRIRRIRFHYVKCCSTLKSASVRAFCLDHNYSKTKAALRFAALTLSAYNKRCIFSREVLQSCDCSCDLRLCATFRHSAAITHCVR